MIQLELSLEEIDTLEYHRYHHPDPQVQRKVEAVDLKSQGLSHGTICRVLRICGNSLRRYLREYQQGGLAALEAVPRSRSSSALEAHREVVQQELALHPVATVKEARRRIGCLTGMERGLTQTRLWRWRLGFRWRKAGMIPAKADPQAQAQFCSEQLEPRLAQAQAGQRRVFFVDAAHFVLGPVLGFLWSVSRVFIRAASGRQRFNVLGALDAVTHEWIWLGNDTYITAQSVCELRRRLAGAVGGAPVSLILDNARYQRCAAVQELAQSLGIELIFLPAYSPNLNLIERLWKFVRKECLASEYYEDFGRFRATLTQFLDTLHQEHGPALASLLTLNFQTFENAHSMAA